MSIVQYSAHHAWMNGWELFLLHSKPFTDPAFIICFYGLIAINIYRYYQEKVAKAQQLEVEMTQLKASVKRLSDQVDNTLQSTSTGLKNMAGALKVWSQGVVALEHGVRTLKTDIAPMTDKIQSLQINFAHLNQRYASLPPIEEVQADINQRLPGTTSSRQRMRH